MAEEMKWTPGPWTVEDPMGGIGVLSIVADGDKEVYEWTHVAQVSLDDDNTEAQGVTLAQAEANAALMAAAPELFDALRELVAIRTIKDGIDKGSGWPDMAALKARTDAAWDAARKALLKAQANGPPQEVRTGDTKA